MPCSGGRTRALVRDTAKPLPLDRRPAEDRAAEVRPSGASPGSKQSVGACQSVNPSIRHSITGRLSASQRANSAALGSKVDSESLLAR